MIRTAMKSNDKSHDNLLSSLMSVSNSGSDMMFKKLLANPEGLNVRDDPNWSEPMVGDKVEIISWDTQVRVQECVRVSKLPYLTVANVNPIIVGTGKNGANDYAWAYEICVNETDLEFLQWHYKILNITP